MNIKAKYILYVGAFIVLTLIGYNFLPRNEIVINTNDFEKINNSGNKEKEDVIYVHIEGAINSPGIKVVSKNTRLYELIKIASGECKDADLSKLNLASILKDEQKVYVPYKIANEEIKLNKSSVDNALSNEYIYENHININTASSKELQKLEGIGPAMAEKILKYREINGYFTSIEDLKNVSGIGEAKFNKIKDNITI